MIKYIEMSDKKEPLKSFRKEENLLTDISGVANAALIIPEKIVVIDFDGDNIGLNGTIYDDMIIRYLIGKYNPYWVRSRENHCHLYFKVPKNLKLKKSADVLTLGGLVVDFLTETNLAIVKTNGTLRQSKTILTEEELSTLPELPSILYPLYDIKKDYFPHFCGMSEGDGRDNDLFLFVNNVNRLNRKLRFTKEQIKESLMFIDNVLFKNHLGENIIDIKIDRNISDLTDISEEDNISLIIKRFSEIEEEETEWIWKPYIPLGCLVALIGEPGVGKSTISAMIAGKLSSGGVFPYDVLHQQPSIVVFQNGEDNPSTTTKRRLIAAGANLDNIVMIDEEECTFNLKRIKALERLIEETKCKLVVIDPIQSYMPAKVNSNDRSDVRKVLSPIKELAQKYGCTIMYLMHTNKNESSKDINRASGSGDFVAITRSVLMVNADEDNKRSYLNHIKSNLARKGPTIEFRIKNDCFEFVRLVTETEKKQKPIDKAVRFIEAFMADEKSVKASDITNSAQNEKISIDTLRKAKEKLNLQSIQRREDDRNVWYWEFVNPPIQATLPPGDDSDNFGKNPFVD